VIVVVGQPLHRVSTEGDAVDGLAARIALASVARGRSVQLVGKVGEDTEGNAIVLALTRGGVGHSALLRDAGASTPTVTPPVADGESVDDRTAIAPHREPAVPLNLTRLEPADVDLALRYLTEFAVLVLAEPGTSDMVRVVTDASTYAGAGLIVLVPAGEPEPHGLPPDAIVFEAPDEDPDGVFASMVGSFAAALDNGGDPVEAFRSSIQADGWTSSPSD
jgi:hypothetical protein